jgi:uncharacterized protein YbjQ (UPF0145 family)
MELLIQVGFVLFFILLGLFAGRFAEKRHLANLAQRESGVSNFTIHDVRAYLPAADPTRVSTLVSGEAVISSDYFKTFVAKLKGFIGGELKTLQTLMDRARREAVLRMIEDARAKGFDSICNVRIEGFDIAGASVQKKGGVVLVAVLASGTAYKRAG